jgi:thioredoxin reductase (NADPH)
MPRRVVRLDREPNDEFCASFDNGRRGRGRARRSCGDGVQYRRLPLDRLADFEGAGVSYAATDMEARYCRNTEAIVVGGGNSAGQAAMYLSRSADSVRLLSRRQSLATSMSRYLSSRLEADRSVTIEYESQLAALHGIDHLEAVTIRDVKTCATRTIETRALFIMIGAAPNTSWLREFVDLDEKGFVKTGPGVGGSSPYATSCPGIFAVGDVRAGSVKRVASSVGEGSVVISKVWEFLSP